MIKIIAILLTCSLLHSFCYGRTGQNQNLQKLEDSTKKTNSTVPPSSPGNTGPSSTTPQYPPAPSPAVPRVESIHVFHSGPMETSNSQQINKDTGTVAYAGNIISFQISGAQAFLKTKPSDQSKVVLYVNGIEMPGITSDWYSQVTTLQIQGGKMPDLKDPQTINIQLVRNAASQNSWNFLYRNTESFTKTCFDVDNPSIGWEHMSPLSKGETYNSLNIAFYYSWEFIAWSILYILILGVFILMAGKTNVLKATSTGPYSLSNTQLLFWTSLVMGAFIYTLLLTDISMSFNTSFLYMLGISLGTTGAATAIDQNKISNNNALPKKTQGFIKDLLTDGDSFSIQRVQSFAWNIILGLYFITYTVKNKTMPEFSNTMLLLAGFSSTSYLTGKLSENTPATAAAQKAQASIATQAGLGQQP